MEEVDQKQRDESDHRYWYSKANKQEDRHWKQVEKLLTKKNTKRFNMKPDSQAKDQPEQKYFHFLFQVRIAHQ